MSAIDRATMIAAVATVAAAGAVWAQETDTAAIAELRAQIEALTREIEALTLGRELVVEADTAVMGLGPAASKVYRVAQGVSLGGYGEVLYENFRGSRQDGAASGKRDQFDALRAVLYVGHKFSDRMLFNSEIEFEHGTTGQGGSVSLEFGYIDYRLSDHLGLRAGLLLAPMGLVNELHEPPIFLGTERPETERLIIPSTWRENGVGVFGEAGGLSYRAYLLNGLDALGGGTSGASGFSAAGLRGGRQKGSRAVAERFALVGRVDYQGILGLTIGTSAYVGESGQGAQSAIDPDKTVGARTLIWEGHGEYKARGLDIRALVAVAGLADAAEINALRGLTGTASVGERLFGWYVHAGYDVLRGSATAHALVPYVRYEQLDTQLRVPAGFRRDPMNDRRIVSLGARWKPITNISVSAEYQLQRNEARTGIDQINAHVAYLF
ncbi:MAG: hypothetical protein ACE5PT_04225 [Gemmatimonadales bacterium]